VNNNPPQAKVWRNYNYPPGQRSRYPGAFRINTVTAVRATSAAPTFFTPVQWEQGLYCDGALVANNPTAIALQEAKVRLCYYLISSYFIPFYLTLSYHIMSCFALSYFILLDLFLTFLT
jgi:Patatin-like phospholipase